MAEFYVENEYWFAVWQLELAMLGMGATLTSRDFGQVLSQPRGVVAGSLIQMVLVPIAAYLFISLFGLAGGIAVGIALIAAVPGGTVSNIFTFFAGGNTALSITITALTTLACLFATPMILELLIASYMPADFEMPRMQIMAEIGFTLLLPLLFGMAYLRFFPGSAAVFSTWCVRGSVVGILLIVAGSLAAGRLDLKAFGATNIALIVCFTGLLAALGWLVPRFLGLSRADSTAIELEVIVRNINLGVLLKASLFPAVVGETNTLADAILISLLLYAGIELLLGAGLIGLYRKYRPAFA